MGFIDSLKNSRINSTEKELSFGAKIARTVEAVAEGSLYMEELPAKVARETIRTGFCSESLLNSIHQCMYDNRVLKRTPALSKDEAIAQHFVNICIQFDEGRRLASKILSISGKFNPEAYMACQHTYYSAKVRYKREHGIDKTSTDSKAIEDVFEITNEMREQFREKIEKKDVLVGRLIKFTWNRMATSMKDIDKPIESIETFLTKTE